MKVVFLEDVEGVAQGGEVKDVKNGFARNFLLPKNLAAPATTASPCSFSVTRLGAAGGGPPVPSGWEVRKGSDEGPGGDAHRAVADEQEVEHDAGGRDDARSFRG